MAGLLSVVHMPCPPGEVTRLGLAERGFTLPMDPGSGEGPKAPVAVTAKTNRSKADKDPAQWLPPLADARCTYAADWVSTKQRWGLSVDESEADALAELADGCGQEAVEYEPAV
ncbi:hypothetical protein [Streptomyces sp. NPDC057552]|uniref:hypothetical protein n=1 Tax=Streptomyces sp. NPDC057552 TaxID=3350537 RepID=UPI0036AEEB22